MSEQVPTEEKTKGQAETTADGWIVERCNCCTPQHVICHKKHNQVRLRCKHSKKIQVVRLPTC